MLVTIKLFPASIKLNLKPSKIIGSLCPTRVISPTSRFLRGIHYPDPDRHPVCHVFKHSTLKLNFQRHRAELFRKIAPNPMVLQQLDFPMESQDG